MQTWSNLADTLVARAELLVQDDDAGSYVGAVYGEAMAAYSKACQLSSSEEGDDLPGLLNNWGVGLHSLGINAKVAYTFAAPCPILCSTLKMLSHKGCLFLTLPHAPPWFFRPERYLVKAQRLTSWSCFSL